MLNIDQYLDIAAKLIAVGAILATVTPNKTDNRVLSFLASVINLVGMNFGHAKNQK